ncbi:MAG: histidinol-phosphatase HisJ family protein [Christensenellales bacterium]
MIDAHTHTEFSFDGRATALNMAEKGKSLGLEYMAFTDHCDRDYAYLYKYIHIRQLNVDEYMKTVSEMKEKYPFLALGIELGYSEFAERDYKRLPLEKFDYVLNSVHTADGLDCYNPEFFYNRSKKEAYTSYLKKVLKSVNADYSFDTITHLGFVRKNAPFDDASLTLSEYGDLIDEILKGIIDKGKTLEINSNVKYKDFMPTKEIVERYFELGGRNVCFSSDAHVVGRVGEMYREGAELAKSIGFEYWTVYRERKMQKIKID